MADPVEGLKLIHPDTLRLLYRQQHGVYATAGAPAAADPEPAASKGAATGWQRLQESIERADLGHKPILATPASTSAAASPSIPQAEIDRTVEPLGEIKGLALSGGGIRSATLSLGVLQAIAMKHQTTAAAAPPTSFKDSMLSDFDYLSTVSGGGYIGAFLSSLFVPGRLRDQQVGQPNASEAADDAIKVLCNEPPGRVRAVPELTVSPMHAAAKPAGIVADRLIQAPLAWLRDNGRYLTPTGSGDGFYAGGLAIRNLVSIHYVIGSVLLFILAGLTGIEGVLGGNLDHTVKTFVSGGLVNGWWFSPAFALAALVLLLWSVPAGAAFWLPYPADETDRSSRWNWACTGYLAVLVLFAKTALVMGKQSNAASAWTNGGPWWYGALAAGIALLIYLVARVFFHAQVSPLRTGLTRFLTFSLQIICLLLAVGIVDTVSHTIYAFLTQPGGDTGSKLASMTTPAAVVGAVIWLVRKLALSPASTKSPGWLAKMPFQLLAGVVGVVILFLIAIAWGLIAVALIWQGAPFVPTTAGTATATPVDIPTCAAGILAFVAALLSLAIGRFPSFINLSSLQSFYAARLTRAYLGASNGKRLAPIDKDRSKSRAKASAAEPMASDQINLDAFVRDGKLLTFAPLHLINVTMNNTAAPGEQLVQRDRKGQPIVVTAQGFSVDGGAVQPFRTGQPHVELDRTLNLGQWTGISGAAFGTGLGRQTSLGLSLLQGVAGIRVGAWWRSGIGTQAYDFPSVAVNRLFPTQSYLFSEFTAKFHGLARPYQYLSDGGHFENTAVYELLRPERHVKFIIACDHGADHGYGFEDLANLIRLARIDMQIELTVETGAASFPGLNPYFGVPADFRKTAAACEDLQKQGCTQSLARGQQPHEPIALLLRASRGHPAKTQAWIVVLKPRVCSDSAADVVQYASTHPDFPQETTADQFFDEAQWESYRKLAYDNANKLLKPEVWTALRDYMARYP